MEKQTNKLEPDTKKKTYFDAALSWKSRINQETIFHATILSYTALDNPFLFFLKASVLGSMETSITSQLR